VKYLGNSFSKQAQVAQILNGKKYIQYSEKFQGKLCFQGKRKLLKKIFLQVVKNPEFNIVKIFRATLLFPGRCKLLKS